MRHTISRDDKCKKKDDSSAEVGSITLLLSGSYWASVEKNIWLLMKDRNSYVGTSEELLRELSFIPMYDTTILPMVNGALLGISELRMSVPFLQKYPK